MPFIDLQKTNQNTTNCVDVCIIGSGIAGAILSKNINKTYKIAVIESGHLKPDNEIQSLYNIDIIGHKVRKDFQSRIRQFGGSCNLWPGRCMALNKIDFKKRDWLNNTGWPFEKNVIDYYYKQAASLLGINFYGENIDNNINDNYALKNDILKNKIYEEKISYWAKKPARYGHKSKFWKFIKNSENIDLYLNANLYNITLNKDYNGVENITIKSLENKKYKFKSKIYIIACGGLENARVLLNCNKQIQNGIGNNNDLVGRYYMDHPTTITNTIKLKKNIYQSDLFGLPLKDGRIQSGIGFNEDYQRNKSLTNNYVQLEPKYPVEYEEAYESFIRFSKRLLRKGHSGKKSSTKDIHKIPEIIYLLTPKDLMPHRVINIYSKINKYFNRPLKTKELIFVHHLEQEPNPNSRVILNNKVDKIGLNQLSLNWIISQKSRETAKLLTSKIYKSLLEFDYIERNDNMLNPILADFKDASHHMGTTRMSNNDKTGVVDKNCKVFGIENLYVSGSSVFPTSGHANPTLTIAALSMKMADYLNKILK